MSGAGGGVGCRRGDLVGAQGVLSAGLIGQRGKKPEAVELGLVGRDLGVLAQGAGHLYHGLQRQQEVCASGHRAGPLGHDGVN